MEEGSDEMFVDAVEDMDVGEDEAPPVASAPRVWDPSVYELQEGEELDYDSSAYKCMHEMGVEWPCLSFDIIPDSLGFMRTAYPQTLYMACGSQAAEPGRNRLAIMKVSNISEMKEEVEEDDMDEADEDYIPIVSTVNLKHGCAINRVKCMPQNGALEAVWGEDGQVVVHNVAPVLRSLDEKKNEGEARTLEWKPVASYDGHTQEGFALAWSPLEEGRLLSGDSSGAVHVWEPETVQGRRTWAVDTTPFRGHTGSVEDVVWSPAESRVFASCSTDGTVRLWDSRGKKTPVLSMQAHADEVNVLSWNSHVTHLLASGADDGVWKVHDLRAAGQGGEAAGKAGEVFSFGFHKQPITSVEWSPFEDSMICVASADDSVTIWDLSATADEDAPPVPNDDPFLKSVPEQLLFLHRGLFDVKEVHWHRQIGGLLAATASNGFHIFAPKNTLPQ